MLIFRLPILLTVFMLFCASHSYASSFNQIPGLYEINVKALFSDGFTKKETFYMTLSSDGLVNIIVEEDNVVGEKGNLLQQSESSGIGLWRSVGDNKIEVAVVFLIRDELALSKLSPDGNIQLAYYDQYTLSEDGMLASSEGKVRILEEGTNIDTTAGPISITTEINGKKVSIDELKARVLNSKSCK